MLRDKESCRRCLCAFFRAPLHARWSAGELQAAIDAGEITIVDEACTDGWLPANAQRNMGRILQPTTTWLTRFGIQRQHR
jgi:hypothetical protein